MECHVLANARTNFSITWLKDNEALSYIGERITVEPEAYTSQGWKKYINTLVIRMVNFQDEG